LDKVEFIRLNAEEQWHVQELLDNIKITPQTRNILKAILGLSGRSISEDGLKINFRDPFRTGGFNTLKNGGLFGSDPETIQRLVEVLRSLDKKPAARSLLIFLGARQGKRLLEDVARSLEGKGPHGFFKSLGLGEVANGRILILLLEQALKKSTNPKKFADALKKGAEDFRTVRSRLAVFSNQFISDVTKQSEIGKAKIPQSVRSQMADIWISLLNEWMGREGISEKELEKVIKKHHRGKGSFVLQVDPENNKLQVTFEEGSLPADRISSQEVLTTMMRLTLFTNDYRKELEIVPAYESVLLTLPQGHDALPKALDLLGQKLEGRGPFETSEALGRYLEILRHYADGTPFENLQPYLSKVFTIFNKNGSWGNSKLLKTYLGIVGHLPKDHPHLTRVLDQLEKEVQDYPKDAILKSFYEDFRDNLKKK